MKKWINYEQIEVMIKIFIQILSQILRMMKKIYIIEKKRINNFDNVDNKNFY